MFKLCASTIEALTSSEKTEFFVMWKILRSKLEEKKFKKQKLPNCYQMVHCGTTDGTITKTFQNLVNYPNFSN